jgi:putative ABC transport system permease protein
MADRTHTTRLRCWLWLIRLIGVLVPRRLRSDWRQEWEAELRCREALLAEWDRLDWRNKLDLLWRSTSAFWDALWLQPQRLEDEMIQDLRYGIRMLLKHKGFTLVAVLTLALGIGANTAIFSVVNAVLLQALPYADPQRLVVLWTDNPKLQLGGRAIPPANPDILEWRARAQSFERLAAFRPSLADLASDGEPERVGGVAVNADFFPLLGVTPLAGRVFTAAEDQPGSEMVAVISHALWQRRFGGVPDIIGKTLTVNARNRVIVGVMPPGFQFPRGSEMPAAFGFAGQTDVWIPLAWNLQRWQAQSREAVALARLKPGVALAQAQAELDTLIKQPDQSLTSQAKGWTVEVRPLHTQIVGDTRSLLLLLLGAVGVVLLIACVNVANLLLTRATTRRRELAVRAALGASRSRIVRQLVTEGLILSFCGGVTGVLLARWLLPVIIAFSPADIPRLDGVRIDALVLGFTLVISVLASVLFGLAPALSAVRVNLNETLKAAGQRTTGSRNRRWTDWLIAAEVALTLMLLVATGLLTRTLARLQAVDPGFRPQQVTAFELRLSGQKYASAASQVQFFEQLLARLDATPGVETAAAISNLPFIGAATMEWVVVEGRLDNEFEAKPMAERLEITPDYFQALGVPLLKGRIFSTQDHAQAPPVVIVNETLARQMLPGKDPLGARIKLTSSYNPNDWRTIVGVVGDVRSYSLAQAPRPQLYYPHSQFTQNRLTVVVESALPHAELIATAKAHAKALDPLLPLAKIQTLEGALSAATASPRFGALLLALFAGLALLLALVGIYGSVAWAVSQRTPEIGLRMALGATPSVLLRLVVGQSIKPVLAGLALGLAGAFALTRLMNGLLFGVSATDPATFVAVTGSLLSVALLACYFPARKATAVDPMVALRSE